MNQNDNSEKPSGLNPSLKLKYANGLGDIITCILHGKVFGKLVHFLTKKNKPCNTCSKRAQALNILFPIKVWKLFFKTPQEVAETLAKEMEQSGYTSFFSKNRENVSFSKIEDKDIKNDNNFVYNETKEAVNYDSTLDNYKLISNNNTVVGDLIIKIEIYKKI
jgi:hypothetical protein